MTKAENIRNQCMKILDKYDADYRGVTVDRIDGTTYVIFKYYGGTNDTVDRNDDSWDEMFELDGVVDVGYGEGYGIEGKYEDSLLIELDEDIVESKKSARKSIKESRGQTVAELLQNASSKTKVYIYSDSTHDEFEGTKEELKGEYSRFLYYTVNIWYIDNDKIMEISCY